MRLSMRRPIERQQCPKRYLSWHRLSYSRAVDGDKRKCIILKKDGAEETHRWICTHEKRKLVLVKIISSSFTDLPYVLNYKTI